MDYLFMPKFGSLAGLHTVFSDIEIAGPFIGQVFAEWGAEVIWIENVAWVDIIRVQPNYLQLSRHNLHALSSNVFKSKGHEAFLKLMKTTDIFIEAGKGPAFTRRGTVDEVPRQHNPELAIAHLSGFGQYGTEGYTDLPAYNTVAQAFSGYLIQNGDVDQPMPASPYTADYFSSLTTTTTALTTLHKVREAGKDESIDIAVYEMMLHMGQYFMVDYLNGGEMCPCMAKSKDPYYAGHSLYRCTDSYVMMELVGITQIAEYFRDIGLAHLLDTPETPEGTQFIHHIKCPYDPLIKEKLNAWLATHTVAEVKERFAELNIAYTKVLIVPELESNPQYVAREPITQWRTMDGHTCRGPNIMPEFENNSGQIWHEMPSHSMDTAAISKNISYSENDIQELVSRGLAKVED